MVLPVPGLAGAEEARLHLVEHQQRLVLVRVAPQAPQELGAKMVVAALALHGLDQDRRDLLAVLAESGLDLGVALVLLGFDVVGDPALQVELDGRVVHARPAELREQPDLVGQRVGQAHRVARAPVEGLLEVQHDQVVHVLVQARAPELARLPVEGDLERVLDRQRTARDPEVVREARRRHARAEGLDEGRHLARVEVRVGRIGAGHAQQLGAEGRIGQLRVVVADRPGREAGEGVQVFLAGARVHQPRAVRALEVEHQREAVRQLEARQGFVDLVGVDHGGSDRGENTLMVPEGRASFTPREPVRIRRVPRRRPHRRRSPYGARRRHSSGSGS